MSVTTANSSKSLFGSIAARPATRRSWVAGALDSIQRRRFVAARASHERQEPTDGYIDRHGQLRLDASTLVALARR